MVEDAQRIGDRELPGTRAVGAEGLEPGTPGSGTDGLDEVGAVLGGCRGRGVGPGVDGLGCRRARHGNDFAAALEVGDGDRSLEHVGCCCLAHPVYRTHAGLAVLDDSDPNGRVALGNVLVDAVVREARQSTVILCDRDFGLLGWRALQQPGHELLQLGFVREPGDFHAFHFRMPTLTCWKRAGAAPWATWAT